MAELQPMPILTRRPVYVLFSGGRDSTVALHWAKTQFPLVKAIYVSLNDDWSSLIEHVRRVAETFSIDLEIKQGPNLYDIFAAVGPKLTPAAMVCKKAMLETALSDIPKGSILVWGSTRKQASVMARMSQPIRREGDYIYIRPLLFKGFPSTRYYIRANRLPIWEGYRQGLNRTACRLCPGQRPFYYAFLRRHHPDLWERLLRFEQQYGIRPWQAPRGTASFTDLANLAEVYRCTQGEVSRDLRPSRQS